MLSSVTVLRGAMPDWQGSATRTPSGTGVALPPDRREP
jgi:hypothetical protein